ncbi:MAG: recombination mediator RecR [Bacteroidetes bacterium]|nr:recombination mediator RecR [Bacteroidota bacterium]
MEFPSKVLEDAVNQYAKLPGVGKRTALRLVLHLLKQDEPQLQELAASTLRLKSHLKFCKECFNISDDVICEICADAGRDETILCVVEDLRDVMAIENTNYFNGRYHVLGGLVSPLDGIGPDDLEVESLIQRIENGKVKELIFAISPTMEGDTTSFYISKRVKEFPVVISTIARGISIGSELEYADEVTLGRSLADRIPFKI